MTNTIDLKKTTTTILVTTLLLVSLMLPMIAYAQPPEPPMTVWGYVFIDTETAPAGLSVYGKDDTTILDEYLTTAEGEYTLSLTGPPEGTPIDLWVEEYNVTRITLAYWEILEVNLTIPAAPPAPAPSITDFEPEFPVSDVEGATRTFSITVDQVVDVSWLMNDTEVYSDPGVRFSSYTNTSALLGVWNVTASASNENGTATQTWIWNVTEVPPPEHAPLPLYCWIFDADTGQPYVPSVIVTTPNLDPAESYRIMIIRFRTGEMVGKSEAITGVTETTNTFTFGAVRPSDLYGTYNVSLYKLPDEVTPIDFYNFGVCGFSGPGYNLGQRGILYGGGAKNGTDVIIDDTLDIFEEALTADEYGDFVQHASRRFEAGDVGVQSATITVDHWQEGYPTHITQEYFVTEELIVDVWTDKDEYVRTETMEIEALVLYQDFSPVLDASVTATLAPPTTSPATVDLTFNSATSTYKGSYHLDPCNETGTWTVTGEASDAYGNSGSDVESIEVVLAVLEVESVIQPSASVGRGTFATWQFNVTYPDDSPVTTLDLAASDVSVKDLETGEIVGTATLTVHNATTGLYNATWYVSPSAEAGRKYAFLIEADALVNGCGNTGPAEDFLSSSFTVAAVTLTVTVETYDAGFAAVKKVFAKGETVGLNIDVLYPTGLPMSVGIVNASIYFPNGTLWDEISLTFNSAIRKWRAIFLPAEVSGNWTVEVLADDGYGNIGYGSTWFSVSGLVVAPETAKGTVGPATTLIDAESGLVKGSIFTYDGKSLGTRVYISGLSFTPNSDVNVTVYVDTYGWYFANYSTYELLVVLNVSTTSTGAFSTSFIFPTAAIGTYTINATDAEGISDTGYFEVIPGMILMPEIVIGPALVEVVATGYEGNAYVTRFMINETDALIGTNMQVMFWGTDGNGTLTSEIAKKPGFIIPILEAGAYEISLSIGDIPAADYIYVVNEFADLMGVIEELEIKLEDLNATIVGLITDAKGEVLLEIETALGTVTAKLEDLNATIVEVKDGVITLDTKLGEVSTLIETLNLDAINASLLEIKDGIVTINTTLGEVRTLMETLNLDAINAVITSLNETIATISSNIGDVTVSVDDIGLKVTSIEGDVAEIETSLGTIEGKVTSIDGKVATIETDVGVVKADVSDLVERVVAIDYTPIWIAVIFAILAFIAALATIVKLQRKLA